MTRESGRRREEKERERERENDEKINREGVGFLLVVFVSLP